MRRGLWIAAVVAGMMIGLTAPASAEPAKVRHAEGGGVFTLNPTCDPAAGTCAFDPTTNVLTITLENPATTTGTFKGEQVLTADFMLDTDDGSFEMFGTIVWHGRVKACGVGTIVYDVVGSGALDPAGTAIFEVNRQTIDPDGTTLPIDGFLDVPGAAPTDENNMGPINYTGQYSCDHGQGG